MTSKYDVIIVGGGIVGTSTAFFLAKSGKRVALIEKGRVAGEQSSRNWGSVRVQGRHPAEVPVMLESIELWRNAAEDLGDTVDWCQNGQMLVACDEASLARLEARIPEQKELGIPSRILSPREVRNTLPHFEGTRCYGAMFNPLDGCAEPHKAAPAFARAAAKAGATILANCAALNVDTHNGSVCGVHTERGELRADAVVVAAGAWTQQLLKPLGIRHPSLWVRGSAALTNPLPVQMRKAVVWGATAYRQRLDGRAVIAVSEDGFHDVMIGSVLNGWRFLPLAYRNRHLLRFAIGRPFLQSVRGEFTKFTTHRTLDPAPDTTGLKKARDLFCEEYPAAGPVTLEQTWAGYIDYMPDELPVVDQSETTPGLFIAAGFSGNGFGIGPGVGKTLSDLITRGQTRHDLTRLSTKRFNQNNKGRVRKTR